MVIVGKNQTPPPKKRRCRRILVGGVAAAMALMLMTAPIGWRQIGHGTLLLMAGIQQPENVAAYLQKRLQPKNTASLSVSAKPNATPEGGTASFKVGDTTVVTTREEAYSDPPPAEDGTGGKVYEKRLDSGDLALEQVVIQNRSGTAVDVNAALRTALSCRFEKSDKPQVLIIHTHTTEGYLPYDTGYYNAVDRNRSADGSCSVVTVGAAVVKALGEAGITAIQDTTVHDSPQYSGAYSRSAQTVEKALQQYPSIKVVLDIHRDAIMQGETGLVKPTVTINGRKAAQMMLLVGVVDTNALPNPYWQQNLALAAQWQKAITDSYPTLMRPLSTVASRYNQHLHGCYLLAEIGTEGNSIDEAVYSGEILGKTLATLLA